MCKKIRGERNDNDSALTNCKGQYIKRTKCWTATTCKIRSLAISWYKIYFKTRHWYKTHVNVYVQYIKVKNKYYFYHILSNKYPCSNNYFVDLVVLNMSVLQTTFWQCSVNEMIKMYLYFQTLRLKESKNMVGLSVIKEVGLPLLKCGWIVKNKVTLKMFYLLFQH